MLFTNLDIRHSITSLHVIIRNNIVRIIYIYQAIRVYNGKPKMLRHVVEDINSAGGSGTLNAPSCTGCFLFRKPLALR